MTEGGDGWAYSNRFGPAGSGADDPRYDDELRAARTDRYDDDPQAVPNGWGGDDRQAASPGWAEDARRAEPHGWAGADRQTEPHGWGGDREQPGYGGPGRGQGPGDPYYEPGYGEQERYGGQDGYGGAGVYRDPGGYGPGDGQRLDQDAYRGWSDYGGPGEYRDRGDYGHPASQGDSGGYDSAPAYPYEGYAPPEPYGRTGYGHSGSYDPYGPSRSGDDPYGDRAAQGPDAGATAAYGWPGEGQQTDPHAPQPYRRADSDDSGSYHGASAFGTDTGSFGPPDSGQFRRADSGSFGQPDSGSYARTDSGSFGRPDSGSFGRADSGSFGRADAGSFGRDGSGSFGRNAPGREEVPLPSRGALPAGSDGYAQWHSDPSEQGSWDVGDDLAAGDDEWADDVGDDDDGPVSRLLARDRRGRGGGEPGGRRRGRRPKRLRGRFALIVAILVGSLVLGMVADFGYQYVHKWITDRYGDYAGGGHGTVRVTVPPGSSLSQLGPTLLKDGVIMALRPYDSAASSAPGAVSLQPGVYQLKHQMNAALAVAALLNPKNRVKDQITIIEGLRASQIAVALAKQTSIPAGQFTKLIDNPPASLGLPKWAAGRSAEGFLFPDTYPLEPRLTPLQILRTMVNDFNHRIASLNLPTIATQKFTTPYHVLIVASLIQAEAGSPGDFKKISRVIWNRLKIGMRLQFDSTVFYAMHTYGTHITQAQESYRSPYNTYLHAGLPPGPIGNPGLLAIQAALHPIDGPTWLYFITDTRHKPYKTYFTSSLARLQQWQKQFQG